MEKVTLSQLLLALFTSHDKAQEIAGDLTEQRSQNGAFWFGFQVLLTCVYLGFQQLRNEPGKLLLISYAVHELVLKLNWMLLLPVKRHLHYDLLANSVSTLVSQSLVNAGSAFLLGMLLVLLSPRKGFLVLLLAAGFVLGRTAILDSLAYMLQIAPFALCPAVLGALAMKFLELRRASGELQKNTTSL